MNIPTIARLRLPDGREFDSHGEVDEKYADGHESWWTCGNASCDCNRSLFLNHEYNLGLTGDVDLLEDDDCLPCGDTITLVSLVVGGQRVV